MYNRIRDLREDHDLLQRQVAEYLCVCQRNYSTYERSNNIPTEALIRLALLYDTNIDYLLGLTDDPTPPKRKKQQ
ncbi:helix-turn-helix domain-containing protein [Candidatus Soleaferrea massiliensis]|uniref:helix-turn-helix domain-containing protein n=1 Tax=Candidatus Soleaferrea massiliensis TaxID=1470354 RepID=UPI000590F164|nr:helix-turn-helix transcriptional regulator [Candidatus Soleaferrea massiliensis]